MLKNFAKLKSYVNRTIPELLSSGEIDPNIAPWIIKFNKIPNLCTIESCEGDKDDSPYLAIVLNSDEILYELQNIKDIKAVADNGFLASINHDYGFMNYYIFYFSRENFDKNLLKIYNRCKIITESLNDRT